MRIFLTGGTGFIGSHLLNCLLKNNEDITALKRTENSKTKILLNKEPKWVINSLENLNHEILYHQDLLVHLAAHSAQPPYDNIQNCIQKNLIEPLALFEKAYQSGIRRFLVAGSCFEYGLSANSYDFIPPDAPLYPIDTYPSSKALASIAFIQWAVQKKVSLSIQRLFYVFGEGEKEDRFYPSIKKAAKNGFDFEMTKGEQIRDIAEVNLIAKIIHNECTRIVKTKKYDIRIKNIGSGNNLSLRDFATKIWERHNAKGKLKIGSLPYREKEIMRFVPDLNTINVVQSFE